MRDWDSHDRYIVRAGLNRALLVLAVRESPESLVLPVFEPTVVQVSRAAPGLSRNLGSGTGVDCEFTSDANEADEVDVGGNIVTGLATIGAAMAVVPITD